MLDGEKINKYSTVPQTEDFQQILFYDIRNIKNWYIEIKHDY